MRRRIPAPAEQSQETECVIERACAGGGGNPDPQLSFGFTVGRRRASGVVVMVVVGGEGDRKLREAGRLKPGRPW